MRIVSFGVIASLWLMVAALAVLPPAASPARAHPTVASRPLDAVENRSSSPPVSLFQLSPLPVHVLRHPLLMVFEQDDSYFIFYNQNKKIQERP